LMLIPSIFIFSKVLNKAQEEQKITTFIEKTFPNSLQEITSKNGQDTLDVKIFFFEDVPDDKLREYENQLRALNCTAKYSLIDAQESGISKEQLDQKTETLRADYLRQIEQEKRTLTTEKDEEISRLAFQLDSLKTDTVIFKSARKELKVLYPLLEDIQYARMQTIQNDSTSVVMPTFLVKWNKKKSRSTRLRDEKRMTQFLLLREELDTLQLIQF